MLPGTSVTRNFRSRSIAPRVLLLLFATTCARRESLSPNEAFAGTVENGIEADGRAHESAATPCRARRPSVVFAVRQDNDRVDPAARMRLTCDHVECRLDRLVRPRLTTPLVRSIYVGSIRPKTRPSYQKR